MTIKSDDFDIYEMLTENGCECISVSCRDKIEFRFRKNEKFYKIMNEYYKENN